MNIQGPTNAASQRRAFALVELAGVVAILLVTFVIASLLLPDARRRARLAGSIQNLQQIGKGAAAFAADNDNRVYSLSWTPGVHTCGDFTFPRSTDYTGAASHQALCILRDRAGRDDITPFSWAAHLSFNHLVLVDYLSGGLPNPILTSPGDAPRLAWVRSLADDAGVPGSAYMRLACRTAAGDANTAKRWPYSSSYEMQPSFFSRDAILVPPGGAVVYTFAQNDFGHRYFSTGSPENVMGNRRMDEVAFPSHKAFLYETNDRFHGSREPFFIYPEARVPVLMPEGSVAVRSTGSANPGFRPNSPNSVSPTRINYIPETSWETPALNGGMAQIVSGHIRWTRSGLRGRDFQGPEVLWTP